MNAEKMSLLKPDNIVNDYPSLRPSLRLNPHETITAAVVGPQRITRPTWEQEGWHIQSARESGRDGEEEQDQRREGMNESYKWLLFSVWPIDSNTRPGLYWS